MFVPCKYRKEMGQNNIKPNFIGFLMGFFIISIKFCASDAYDPMDPNGNITIKWDVMEMNGEIYKATVSILNHQLYRHVEAPGWKLGWAWQGKEVIWSMLGAEATDQGNCSMFTGYLPHCCERKPVIVDLLPGTPYNQQTKNCCKGGVLSSMTQDHAKYGASFELSVGRARNYTDLNLPTNFSLGIPGYTCGPAYLVDPTRFSTDQGRRWTRALMTWNVTCTYSQFLSSSGPTCCVSLSSFYDSTIVPCPQCSCGCERSTASANCVKADGPHPLLQMPHGIDGTTPVVTCTPHMCPIRVHWHVKQSYKDYWRVKVTVTNFNYAKNYSQWNLEVQHPNLESITQIFSFNYKSLNHYGYVNDTGMFWGVQYYNEMLLEAGKNGNVQTEILLRKDPGIFTFNEGWAFPRRISFNGDVCVMPPPDAYPILPNSSSRQEAFAPCNFIRFFSLMLFVVLLF
ncbi:COBRA-like protein 1 [Tasmannia lanceolata]|uniref:COBRA-like protein 1 n=1 Tax=Tasmannia lanceolata TaxID=3420 RepID=UPI004063C7A5